MNRYSEFDIIKRFFSPLSAEADGAFGLANDAALWQPDEGCDAVITTDCLVAGVHFFASDPPDSIAEKLLAVNLSDIAAMGARPTAYTLTAILSEEIGDDWIGSFAKGLRNAQKKYAVVLLGGDTVATPGPLTFSLTTFGSVERGKALSRGGAHAGDDIYVSGTIGDAALGLQLLRKELHVVDDGHADFLINRYRRPEPRLEVGNAILGIASSAIDVSDGLSADLGHIAQQSCVDIEVKVADVPLSGAVKACTKVDKGLLECILGGGDDYELAFSATSDQRAAISALSNDFSVKITKIGRAVDPIDDNRPEVQFVDTTGSTVAIKYPGYRHF